MRYLVFGPEKDNYPVAILTRHLNEQKLCSYLRGIEQDVVAYAIETDPKAKNETLKEFLLELLPILCNLKTNYILVTEASIFKILTKQQQVSKIGGYVVPCVFEGYTHFNILYVPSPAQLFHDPSLIQKAEQGLCALQSHRQGTYFPPGTEIIKFEKYPKTLEEISWWLDVLVDDELAIDIEGFGLKHYTAGIGTISMAWRQHDGIAFPVDYQPIPGANSAPYGKQVRNGPVRKLLREFFRKRFARTMYHNISYDVYVLIYQLFMDDLLDTSGLLGGLDVMLKNWDDTLLITYLATNSCAGNHLSLKEQAQEFAGNYALDVIDITSIPLDRLLRYNLVDSLSTWFVYNKHYQTMVNDQQLEIYQDLFKPAMVDVIQMQLTGMPLNMEQVQIGKAKMQANHDKAISCLVQSPLVKQAEVIVNERWVTKRNSELKVKRVTLADAKESFNFNSSLQLQMLLHEVMKLPVIETTDKGQPSTGMETLEALQSHTQDKSYQDVLSWLIEFKQVEKLLTAFIPAFEQAPMASDGRHYVYGSYNLGGTLSGRLSSNNPNMQNLPSSNTKFKGQEYSKIIKEMFQAPPGWLLVGLDFNGLEDRISALTTKDPNKIKVFTQGFDGHSLRAFYFFGEKMPDIVETVESINSIQKKYKGIRFDSKSPYFALTYQGTWLTLVKNCGFKPDFAKQIEFRYHEMYEVSDKWVQKRLEKAQETGYVTVAFGLRLRTPLLAQTRPGARKSPMAAAESRTAGNAMGQSYGLLNSRSAMAFNKTVRASQWRLDIKPCSQIHDAQYFLVRDDAELLSWMNQELIKEVQWQSLPEIEHDEVKLGGELSIFYPNWANELSILNGADAVQILKLAQEHLKK